MSRFTVGIDAPKIECAICGSTGTIVVFEVCDACDGEGCVKCNHSKEVRKEHTCQCRKQNKLIDKHR